MVLVDGMTASAAEILASALQSSDRAVVVGQKTFGKGTLESQETQPDGSSKRAVVARILTAGGDSIDGIGITPDRTLDAGLSKEEALQQTVQILSKQADVKPQVLATGVSAAASADAMPPDLRQGLILHYDFEESPASGNVADTSGHGNDGHAVNVQWGRDGQRGGIARFGLTDSYIVVANKDELDPPHFTLATWLTTSYGDKVWRRIFDKSVFDKATGGMKGYDLTMGGDYKEKSFQGQVGLEVDKAYPFSGAGHTVADGQWHHVVGTFDGVYAKLYVDGNLVNKQHWEGEASHIPCDLGIGGSCRNKSNALNGMLDDVMIYNRALTTEEVQALFKLQGGVPK